MEHPCNDLYSLNVKLICSPDLGPFGGADFLESGFMEAVQDEETYFKKIQIAIVRKQLDRGTLVGGEINKYSICLKKYCAPESGLS
jgi:hypothetical protein